MGRPPGVITACPHVTKRHYARGRCKACWTREWKLEIRREQMRLAAETTRAGL